MANKITPAARRLAHIRRGRLTFGNRRNQACLNRSLQMSAASTIPVTMKSVLAHCGNRLRAWGGMVPLLWLGTLVFSVASCAAPQRPDGGSGLLGAGARAPAVRGVDQVGMPIALDEFRGASPVVVFFYPKDGTPGCTKEACAFRDAWTEYQKAGVAVIGVSQDPAADHIQFSRDHQLPLRLVSDEQGVWGRAFGVSSFLGLYQRVSYLIGKDGRVSKVYPDVDPAVHAREVLRDVGKL